MTEKELVAKAKSACKHNAGTRRAEQESPDVVDLDKHQRSLKAILEDKALKVRWVIEGLLAAGALVIMAGSPKTGKITLIERRWAAERHVKSRSRKMFGIRD